jgi:membrane dipeptidase
MASTAFQTRSVRPHCSDRKDSSAIMAPSMLMRRPLTTTLFWLTLVVASGHRILPQELAAAEPATRPPVVLTDAARDLHAAALVIDGHNDLPWEIRKQGAGQFERMDIAQPQPKLQTDIPRLRQGGVGAQFWSVWVPVDTAKQGAALATTLEQIDLVRRMLARYPETFELARTADDIERIHRSGKIASLIGVEGGHSIEGSLTVLRRLHELGAAYMTLTHSESLDWCDSGTDAPRCGGLSPFGEEVVHEMNRLGMLVDVSHVSPDAMRAVLRVTKAPVIFSHSSARAIADHPRNVPDDVLRLTKANGGLVMVNFYSSFLVPSSAKLSVERLDVKRQLQQQGLAGEALDAELNRWDAAHPPDRGTIHTLIDHIEHIIAVAGIDHVGLGSDYDGITQLPEQLNDVSTYPYITQALLNRGHSADDLRKFLGGNLLRVMRAAERAAQAEPAK